LPANTNKAIKTPGNNKVAKCAGSVERPIALGRKFKISITKG
jgi:hypothetical protein